MSKNTKNTSTGKPGKPYPDFPLFAHAAGVWAKKICGKLHYFGPWSDPEGALQRYVDRRDDLQAGRVPRVKEKTLAVGELLDGYLSAKKAFVDSGEILSTTFDEYHRTCVRIGRVFGLKRLVNDLPDA